MPGPKPSSLFLPRGRNNLTNNEKGNKPNQDDHRPRMAKQLISIFTLLALSVSVIASPAAKYLRSRNIDNVNQRSLQSNDNFPFIEENGMVVMEAESGPIIEPWKVEQIYNGYTGSGHIRFDGNSVSGGNVTATMSYFIQIDTPGQYALTMRARKNHTEWDKSNDCFAKMVGHEGVLGNHVKLFLGGRPRVMGWNVAMEWGHHNFFDPVYDLSAKGTYELQISGRSKHFVIDRIVLYNTALFGPREAEVQNTPESPRLDGPGAPPSAFQGLQLTTAGPGIYSLIQDIEDGDVISLGAVGTSTGILLQTAGEIGSVLFEFDGNTRSEGSAPFTLNGGDDDSVNPVQYLSYAGTKVVTTTLFDDDDEIIVRETITFTLIDATVPPTPAPQTPVPTNISPTTSPTLPPPTLAPISSAPATSSAGVLLPLLLTTAGNTPDLTVQTLTDGGFVDQLVVGKRLSVIAEATSPVKLIKFFYGGKVWTEGLPPYAMVGNVGTRNNPVQYLTTTGVKRVVVKAYDAGNNEIGEIDVTFTIVEGLTVTDSPTASPSVRHVTPIPTALSQTDAPSAAAIVTASPTASPSARDATPIPTALSQTDAPSAAAIVTASPTASPSARDATPIPTALLQTDAPSEAAIVTASPTAGPTEKIATSSPTAISTELPTVRPTNRPTDRVVTSSPTASPTDRVATASPTDPILTSSPTVSSTTLAPPSLIQSLTLTTAGGGVSSTVLVPNFKSGDVIHVGSTGTDLSILVNIDPLRSDVSKVTFEYGGVTWNEGLAPYAMAGNWNDLNHPVEYLSTPGAKLLTIEVKDSSSTVLETATYTFYVNP